MGATASISFVASTLALVEEKKPTSSELYVVAEKSLATVRSTVRSGYPRLSLYHHPSSIECIAVSESLIPLSAPSTHPTHPPSSPVHAHARQVRTLLAQYSIDAEQELVGVVDEGEGGGTAVPTLVDHDILNASSKPLKLHEANSILRYLASSFCLFELYPLDPARRAEVDLHLDCRASPAWHLTLVRLIAARVGFTELSEAEDRTIRERCCASYLPEFFELVGPGPLLGGQVPNLADYTFAALFAVAAIVVRNPITQVSSWPRGGVPGCAGAAATLITVTCQCSYSAVNLSQRLSN